MCVYYQKKKGMCVCARVRVRAVLRGNVRVTRGERIEGQKKKEDFI